MSKLPVVFNKAVDEWFDFLFRSSHIARSGLTREEQLALTRLVRNTLNQLYCFVMGANLGKEVPFLGIKKKLKSKSAHKYRYSPEFVRDVRAAANMLSGDHPLREELLFLTDEVKDAVDLLFMGNLRLLKRLVLSIIAKKPQAATETLFAEAHYALLCAIYSYSPYKGIALTTYISWWVKSMVGTYLDREKLKSSSPPPEWFDKMSSVFSKRTYKQLLATKKQPSPELLEEVLGIWPGSFFSMLKETISVKSLATPTEIETELQERIPGEFPEYEEDLDKERLRVILQELPDIDRKIVFMRFGFGGRERSLQEIAEELGMSKVAVHKRLAKVMEKLRDAFRSS